MTGVITKVLASVLSKIFYAFFTERMVSRVLIELMRILASKTTNTLDDSLVEEVAANVKF
ncbi:hypothetical protein Dacet_1139 [Denitrovibrio acetiphilus DSM 12809]|uniref:Uncharacterized protein n=1 Tax=Denitrovibrio acetiphilus (strain DSM 12809 / NBRC 114555 / N2460) TaxID=522772 RepID=D4H7B2_DENA2|nr:hypothetical protein [Denitrovibrio acetiphilus]ADD67911.1 hypothetical protein Dacet_1139 [Denitrovibrio acetiphilus DSM 12809]